uniref:Gustatory receptor n=1 Tax=Glossina pallidipes TaxID=7398 RepID=A0A1B0A807_GLOPL
MDIVESISVLQTVYQLANLSPWILDKKTWSFLQSRVLELYTTIVIIGSSALMLYSLFTDDIHVKASDNDIGQTVDSVQMVGVRMAHIASVLESLLRKNDQKKFYDDVKEIDRIFESSLGITINNRLFRRKTVNRGVAMFLIYMLSEFFILASKLITTKHNFFLFWMFYLLPMLICGIRYFQMFTSILIIKERLNELIAALDEVNLTAESFTPMRTTTAQNHSRYIFSPKRQQESNIENSPLTKLVVIRNIYDRLHSQSVVINHCFGVSMLINVGNDFISITSNCYWIFINFKNFSSTVIDFLQIACSAIWSIPHLLNVLVLAFICERTVHTSVDMALILHRINSNLNNDKYGSAVTQFSLQLLHQKLSLTAAGFFTIDSTLLYTIVGATTTYLIILIQFNLNEIKPNT